MDDKKLHIELRRAAIFGALSVGFALLMVVGLINNGNGAVDRYNRLIAVDKAGGDVDGALDELRSYIYSHMNTEIGGPNGIYPPIQLKGTYERLVASEETRVNEINDELIVEAKEFCEDNGPSGFSGRNRVDCVNKFVDENGAQIQPVEESLYKFDFVSPRWSPDLAGFSLVALILSVSVMIFNIFMYFRTKHLLHIAN